MLRTINTVLWRRLPLSRRTLPHHTSIDHSKFPTAATHLQRGFRTTPGRNAVPPFILMLLSKIGQGTAVILGRQFRHLAPDQKAAYLAKARKHRGYFYALLSLIGVGGLTYYTTHIEEAPITRRMRFLAFSEEQWDAMEGLELKALLEMYKDILLPATDPRYERVFGVAQKLIDANRDLLAEYGKSRQWTVSLVDDVRTSNAFVLSCGSIFVFTGLLDLCDEEGSSDSTLAIILGHELAHVLLSHACEQASALHLLDYLLIIPFLLLWSLVPTDLTAAAFHWILGKVSDVLFTLPYSRTLETEADEVGLVLAAKACFDVRECLIWKKLEIRSKEVSDPGIDLLSTHPSDESRYENLSSKLSEALALRESCNCPRLPPMDELRRIEDYSAGLRLERAQFNRARSQTVEDLKS